MPKFVFNPFTGTLDEVSAAADFIGTFVRVSGDTMTGTLNTLNVRPSTDGVYGLGDSTHRYLDFYGQYAYFSAGAYGPAMSFINDGALQYSQAGFYMYTKAATMGNNAGVHMAHNVNDAGITQGNFAIDKVDYHGNYVTGLMGFDLNTNIINMWQDMRGYGFSPQDDWSYNLGDSSHYWANFFTKYQQFSSTAQLDGTTAGAIFIYLSADTHTYNGSGFVSTGSNVIIQGNGFALGESAGNWNGTTTGILSARTGLHSTGVMNGIYGYFYASSGSDSTTVASAIYGQTEGYNNSVTVGWVNAVTGKSGGGDADHSGVVTNAASFHAMFQDNSYYNKLTNAYGFYGDAIANGTNRYGMFLNDVSGGTLNYAIYTNAGDVRFGGKFGANGATPQAAAASGGAAPAGGTGATAGAYDTAAHRDALITLVNNIRTALVNNGIMS